MIDVKELRIGDFIKRRSKDDTLIVDIQLLTSVSRSPVFFDPIPLTEEWLIKFGFTKNKYHNFSLKVKSFTIEIDFVKGCVFGTYLESIGIDFQYTHQLQNLHFALTGKELKEV